MAMWWRGLDPLEEVAARTMTPAQIQDFQAWLINRAMAERRRLDFDHRCIECGQKRQPQSHGARLRCGSCAASWRMRVKKLRVSAWLEGN